MKLLFIMNPTSGRKGNDDGILAIHHAMAEHKFDFKFHYTTGDNDDRAIQHQIETYAPDRIMACGGDGTVQLVARNLINKRIPMGILPLGSANGLATALGLPQDVDDAVSCFVKSQTIVPLDLLHINDHVCIHLSDIGTNALLVKNYEAAGDKGMIGYAKHLIDSIRRSELMEYTITTETESIQKQGYMLTIANANKYGTGVQVSEGSVSDGKFEICNVQNIDLESAVKAGLTAINVFVDKNMFSDVISCRRAHIEIDRLVHLQIDGEYMGEVKTLDVDMIPAALQLVVNS